jgi:hypothetical protein
MAHISFASLMEKQRLAKVLSFRINTFKNPILKTKKALLKAPFFI